MDIECMQQCRICLHVVLVVKCLHLQVWLVGLSVMYDVTNCNHQCTHEHGNCELCVSSQVHVFFRIFPSRKLGSPNCSVCVWLARCGDGNP